MSAAADPMGRVRAVALAGAATVPAGGAAPAREILAVRSLTTEIPYVGGTLRVVDDVSFSIAAGELVGLVGETGCGKTMTALSVINLLPPGARVAAGEIVFDGVPLDPRDEDAIRSLRGRAIGTVLQNARDSLHPMRTVGVQLARVHRAHLGSGKKAARAAAVESLASVGMADPERVAGLYPHEISGGMAQRVMIAIALMCRPSLVIADEPTTGLDVTVQYQVLKLLQELLASGGTAGLLITHDLGLVAHYCERVMVMYAGQLVEEAPVDVLFAAPRHPYTRALLAASMVDEQLQKALVRDGSGKRFEPPRGEKGTLIEVGPRHRVRRYAAELTG
jgi:peptide/nickel transport system ATP-binding protein